MWQRENILDKVRDILQRKGYTDIEWIGQGGFGVVYKAFHRLEEKVYALKCIHLPHSRRCAESAFLTEVKILSKLNHRNVVLYHDAWIEELDLPENAEQSEHSEADSCDNSDDPILALAPPPCEVSLEWTDSNSDGCQGHQFTAPPERCDLQQYSTPSVLHWSVKLRPFESTSLSEALTHKPPINAADGVSTNTVITAFITEQRFASVKTDLSSNSVAENQPAMSSVAQCGAPADVARRSETGSPMPKYSCGVQKSVKKSNEEENAKKLQFLFIKMDFCKMTLEKWIENHCHTCINYKSCLKIIKEMLQGLRYIHSQGVIHRDLKPGNIFIDQDGSVKIGDFGLSRFCTSQDCRGHKNEMDASIEQGTGSEKLTANIGTHGYLAPEVRTMQNKAIYNLKADMYSFGMVILDMLFQCTAQERQEWRDWIRKGTSQCSIHKLFANKTKNFLLQPEFLSLLQTCGELLQDDPLKRPSAEEILHSKDMGLLQEERSRLEEILNQTLSSPDRETHRETIRLIFERLVGKVSKDQQFAYYCALNEVMDLAFTVSSSKLWRSVERELKRIFQKHGAVPMDIPEIIPFNVGTSCRCDITTMLSSDGYIYEVTLDHKVPLVRFVHKNKISEMKRYCVKKRFLPNGLPYQMHCAFDIIDHEQDSIFAVAELIQIVSEIVSKYPVAGKQYEHLIISHTLLEETLFNNQSPECRSQDHCSKACVGMSFDAASQHQEKFLQLHPQFGFAISQCWESLAFLQKLFVDSAFIVKVGSLHATDELNLKHYEGVLFALYNATGSDFLVFGGQYTKLLRSFDASFGPLPELSAAGLNINLQKLVGTAAITKRPERMDKICIHCSPDTSPETCFKLARKCWEAGIHVRLMTQLNEVLLYDKGKVSTLNSIKKLLQHAEKSTKVTMPRCATKKQLYFRKRLRRSGPHYAVGKGRNSFKLLTAMDL